MSPKRGKPKLTPKLKPKLASKPLRRAVIDRGRNRKISASVVTQSNVEVCNAAGGW